MGSPNRDEVERIKFREPSIGLRRILFEVDQVSFICRKSFGAGGLCGQKDLKAAAENRWINYAKVR